ncbi:protein NRT1/ PTR FAMILY 1.2-like, partial [Capsicum annuum]|uniref:protein NRT1/ PTR FAMILY 1.2-like n=1 Tax=Capsicum annuum TaxID=4072 RepID=UPI001FB07FA8
LNYYLMHHFVAVTLLSPLSETVGYIVLPAPADDRYNSMFLNKACIIQDPQLDLSPDGEATDPWRLCTVDQVEELKALLKVVPIWLTGAVMAINISQTSFPVLQATTMDRNVGSSFEIPAASFGIFIVISGILWIVLYDCLILPVASKLTGKPTHFSTKERMGFGLFFSFLSVLVVAVVEGVWRNIAIKE